MATRAHASRVELLTREFANRGMSEEAAEDLSCHVVLNHPLAQKLGIDNLAREIATRGMPGDRAREAATLLLAIELMNRGATYDTVISRLELEPISPGEALAGALDASRIQRQTTAEQGDDTGLLFIQLAAGATALTFALIVLALFISLAG